MLKLIIVAVVIVGFSIAGIAIKMFFQKKGEFKKSCSTIDPKTGLPLGCTCGKQKPGDCDNKTK